LWIKGDGAFIEIDDRLAWRDCIAVPDR